MTMMTQIYHTPGPCVLLFDGDLCIMREMGVNNYVISLYSSPNHTKIQISWLEYKRFSTPWKA